MYKFTLKEHPIAPLRSLNSMWPLLAALMLAVPSLPLSPLEARAQEQAGAGETVVTHMPTVFERLWRVWPKKEDKEAAIQAWNALKISEEDLDRMRAAFPRWKFSEDWLKERGKYAPTLATWLNERMWEKVPPPPAPNPPLRLAEVSDFLLQPLYLVPRFAFAVGGVIVGGIIWLNDEATAKKVWDASLDPPWVWHHFVTGEKTD